MSQSKRVLFVAVLGLLALFTDVSTAQADSYYRINMRAYRRMMHYQGPHPLMDRFWGVVDNQLLQQGGLLEQFLKALLAKNLPAASDTSIAQRPVKRDTDLAGAQNKIREMCKDRNIPYEEIELKTQPPVGTPNGNADTDLVKFRTVIGIAPSQLTQ